MLAHLARRHARPMCRIATPRALSRRATSSANFAPLQNIELTFLGTGSSQPSFSRKQSSTAIRIAGETWLLDCGEATQIQMMHAGLSIDDVTRIYITHLHGDHINGMAGLLSGKSNSSKEHSRSGKASSRLQIYGPSGIRSFLRAALGNTYSNFSHLELQVFELDGLHALRRYPPPVTVDRPLPNEVVEEPLQPESQPHPLKADRFIKVFPQLPQSKGWDNVFCVKAVEIEHTVPTVGYIFEERPRPGRLNADKIHPILAEHGIKRSVLGGFKNGTPIDLPDGTQLHPKDFCEVATSRKLVLLGDTKDASSAVKLAHGADVVVHECTNAFLKEDFLLGRTKKQVQQATRAHGHSTPDVGAKFAKDAKARNLYLNHFSQRYPGSGHYGRKIMATIRKQAKEIFDGEVIPAVDFLRLIVRPSGDIDEFWPRQYPPGYFGDPWSDPDADHEHADEPRRMEQG